MIIGKAFKKKYSQGLDNDCFPEIQLQISNCFRESLLTVGDFTIDTGASNTCINDEIYNILDLEYHHTVTVEYGDGGEIEEKTCLVDLGFPQLGFVEKKLEVIILPKGVENLLGRDILNKISLFLYGKKQMFKIKV